MSEISNYPLCWPIGKPRTKYREQSRFRTALGPAIREVQHQVGLLGGRKFVLSSNLMMRLDGLPYANQRQPGDPGVAIYFEYKQKPMCFACDRWFKVEENMWATAKTIEALRGIERWGTGSMVEQAFTGFQAIEPPKERSWRSVLGFETHPVASLESIEAQYRDLAKRWHPDNGGSAAKMAELNEAIAAARKELR